MALSREQLIDAAIAILRDHGLASLSMRNLAKELGVQPGALYWHVKSKQDLLALVAERILTTPAGTVGPVATSGDARQAAVEIRAALLSVRDGAEIVSLAHALHPRSLAPMRELRVILARALTQQQADWGARVLTHYILGAVAEEQNRAELARAGALPDDPRSDCTVEAYLFGVDVILGGLTAIAARTLQEP
jgi:TetR/AcrR family tetracycline transcriptional repressor